MRFQFKRTILIVIFLTGLCNAYAQQTSDTSNQLLNIPLSELLDLKVLSASKVSETRSDAPANIVIITRKQIEDRGYHDLSDVMLDLPGVDIVNNARGYGEYYTINGIEGNDRFLVLVDGKKINPPGGTFLSIGNSISVQFARQIEILYGPASVFYGADAYSGVINILSSPAGEELSLSARYGLGSNGTHDLNVEISDQISPDFSFMASARLFLSQGPDFSQRDTIYKIINRYQAPQRPVFEQPISDNTIFLRTDYKDLSLTYFRQGFNEGNALGVHPNGFIYNRENKWKIQNSFLGLDYEKALNDNSGLSFNFSLINSSIDPETQWYKWFGTYNVDSAVSQYMTGEDYSIRTSLYYHNQINDKLRIQSGIEGEMMKSIPPYANDQILHKPVKFEGTNADLIRDNLTLNETRLAALTQVLYQPLPMMKLVLGGRYDFSTRYKGVFNPRSAIIIEPVKHTTIKALYGTAFQAPSLFFQYEQFGDPWLVMYSMEDYKQIDPNWTLEPQKVSTFELSITQGLTDNLIITGKIYRSDLTNLISRMVLTDSVFNKFYSTPNHPLYSSGIVNTNIGNQTINGAMFLIRGRTENITFEASYSFTDANSILNQQMVPISRVAKHKFLGMLTWENAYFTLSPRVRIIGPINNENASRFPDGEQPGYAQVDFFIKSTPIFKGLTIFGRFNNVFDSHIEHGGLQRQSFGYLPTIIQDGFNFQVGGQWDLSRKQK